MLIGSTQNADLVMNKERAARRVKRRPLERFSLSKHLAKELDRIDPKGLADRNEFGHIDLPLMALDHADDGMRPPQECGQLALG